MDPRHIRVGDNERTLCMEMLNHAFGQGMLSFVEFDERCGKAAAAVTRGELDDLIADLPLGQKPASQHGPGRPGLNRPVASHAPEALQFSAPAPQEQGMRIFSTHRLEGRWSVGDRIDAPGICSTLEYNFSSVERTSRIIRIDCRLLMSELKIIADPGTMIINDGVNLILSEVKNKLPEFGEVTYQSAPLILQLGGLAALSTISVKPPRGWKRIFRST